MECYSRYSLGKQKMNGRKRRGERDDEDTSIEAANIVAKRF